MTKSIVDEILSLDLPTDSDTRKETAAIKTASKLKGKIRQQQSNLMSGSNNPMFGKQHPNKGKTMPQISKKIKGKKKPDGFGDKISQARKGKPNPKASKPRPEHSMAMSGSNNPMFGKTIITYCEYCNRDINGASNYSRWHGQNCKSKTK